MGIGEAVREALAADDGVADLLTGGIYAFEATGRNGISRVTTPEAYDAGGFLKPCAVVKMGSATKAAAIRDDRSGMRQRVEVYLYDDGDRSFDTIHEAAAAVSATLDRQWIEGAGYVRQVGGMEDQRDAKLNNAALVRVDFDVTK
jgi:hypothetical protein